MSNILRMKKGGLEGEEEYDKQIGKKTITLCITVRIDHQNEDVEAEEGESEEEEEDEEEGYDYKQEERIEEFYGNAAQSP